MKLTKEVVVATITSYDEIWKRAAEIGRAVYLAERAEHKHEHVYRLEYLGVPGEKVSATFTHEPDWSGSGLSEGETTVEFPLALLCADDWKATCAELEAKRTEIVEAAAKAAEARKAAEEEKKKAAKEAKEKAEFERLKAKYEGS